MMASDGSGRFSSVAAVAAVRLSALARVAAVLARTIQGRGERHARAAAGVRLDLQVSADKVDTFGAAEAAEGVEADAAVLGR